MDKTLAGVIGAVGALVAAPAAQAAIVAPPTLDAALQANSYSDLLKPIPNALALLRASAATPSGASRLGLAPRGEGAVRLVDDHDHHHHQDHHHHHHDHHHHNNGG